MIADTGAAAAKVGNVRHSCPSRIATIKCFANCQSTRLDSARTAPTGRALRFPPRFGRGGFLERFNGNLAITLDIG